MSVTTPTGPVEGFPAPGERIGPYEIVRQLGMGGMGVVYEAVDTVLQRRVALKVISPYLAGDPAFRIRFTQEAQAQASLDSPHVVQVFAHGEADGSLYIASQLIPDGDLGAMIRAQGRAAPARRARPDRPGRDRARRCPRDGARAPRHQAGQRVAADPRRGRLGLPRGLRHRPADRRRPGSQPDADDAGVRDRDADLHGAGAAHRRYAGHDHGRLLTGMPAVGGTGGRAPYTGTTDYQLVTAHVSAPVPQIVAAGPFEREVNRILRSAMAKHPSERYPSAAALRDDLRRVLQTYPRTDLGRAGHRRGAGDTPADSRPGVGELLAVHPGLQSPEHGRPRPRTTTLIVAIAVGLVLLVGVGIVGGVLALRGGMTTQPGGTSGGTTSGPTNEDGLTRDERVAADNIAAALDANPTSTRSTPSARRASWCSGPASMGLQEQGLLDEDLTSSTAAASSAASTRRSTPTSSPSASAASSSRSASATRRHARASFSSRGVLVCCACPSSLAFE